MMGVSSRPWSELADAVRRNCPDVIVHVAEPGFELDLATGTPAQFKQAA